MSENRVEVSNKIVLEHLLSEEIKKRSNIYETYVKPKLLAADKEFGHFKTMDLLSIKINSLRSGNSPSKKVDDVVVKCILNSKWEDGYILTEKDFDKIVV